MTSSIRPVRVTVELQPTEHRDLQKACGEMAEELDRPRVAGVEVFRALLAEMGADSKLRSRVMARIAAGKGAK